MKKLVHIIKNPRNYRKYANVAYRKVVRRVKKVFFIENVEEFLKKHEQLRFYRKYITENALVFDIGANIGKKTDLFLELGCRVVAVEPQSQLARKIRERYIANKNLFVEQCGIGENEGEAEINISTKYPGFSSFHKSWQVGTKYHVFDKTEKVKTTTLENLIKKYGAPYFCKIDVEGFEPQVLSGLVTKIPLINFEFHSNDEDLIKICIEKLKKIGYKEFNFILFENTEMVNSRWVDAEDVLLKIKSLEKERSEIIWGDIYAR